MIMNMRHWVLVIFTLVFAAGAFAQNNSFDIDTPAINTIKNALRQRHAQLRPLYVSGALGLVDDGTVVLRDISLVPLAQRGQINTLIAADNADRNALYREVARANNHPEWEGEVRKMFALRWIERAPAGWWVKQDGVWKQK